MLTPLSSNIYDYSVLLAPGCGSTLQSGYSIAAAKVKLEEVVAAIGFIHTGQLGSTVVALNIAGSISQNLAFNDLKVAFIDHHFTAAELKGAIAGTQSSSCQQGDERIKQMTIQAIIKAMESVFALAIVEGSVSVVSGQRRLHEEGKFFMSMAAAIHDL